MLKMLLYRIWGKASDCLTIIMMVSLIAVLFSGCSFFDSDDEPEGDKVSLDTPWYNCEITKCSCELDSNWSPENHMSQYPIGKISDGYVLAVQGYDQYEIARVYLFTDDGILIEDIDLVTRLHESFPNLELTISSLYRNLYIKHDSLKMIGMELNEKKLMVFDIDILYETISLSGSYDFPQCFNSYGGTNNVAWTSCGDYDLFVSMYDGLSILTVDPNGEAFCLDPGNEFSRELSGFVSDLLPVSDTQVLFFDNQTYTYFLYDASVGNLTDETSEYDWIKPYFNYYRSDMLFNIGSDGKPYFITPDAVATPDFENKCMKDIVRLEDVDINRAVFASNIGMYRSVLEAEEGNVELMFTDFETENNEIGFELCKAERAKDNPNIGKTIITTDGFWLDAFYDAVWSFNRMDEEYFIRIVSNAYAEDERRATPDDILYTRGDVGDRMRVDLIAGDCPDVVFYASSYGQLNNGDCMVDLKPYYDSSELKGKVFDNIVESCEYEGGLYAMPLSFDLNGIIVDRSKFDAKGSGMTFERFEEFTDQCGNGINVVSSKKTRFLTECLKNEYDLFERDGRMDFDCPEFRELAEYTNAKVFDVKTEDYLNLLYMNKSVTSNTCIEGYLGWFGSIVDTSCDFGNAELLGLPSSDGRGPAAEIKCFASITNGTKAPKGAWKFIETLMSNDVQKKLCKELGTYQNSFPINREAFDAVGADCVEIFNHQQVRSLSTYYAKFEDLSTIKEVTEEVDHIIRSDSNVDIIVYEEMQSYLAGDKSIDDVIKIMNNRAKTVKDERG